MDPTAEDARDAKRARLTTPPAGEVVDRISGLGDDVLLRVLELVADARDAVRTGALSRRWLGLWTRARALRFAASLPLVPTAAAAASGDEQRAAALERYFSFVNGVLARRARSDCAVECLAISYTTAAAADTTARVELEQLMPASVDAAVQDWIRYAFLHGVKSFAVDLRVPPEEEEEEEEDEEEDDHRDDGEHGSGKRQPLVIIDELPSPERLETMHLALGDARLQHPTTMRFASLTDLSLERIKLAPGGAQLLARLVSSANCPRLRKLRLSKLRPPSYDEEMLLDANVLLELWVEDFKVRSLELRTPSLRVFHIDICCYELLKVSTPRLEELTFFQLGYPPLRLEVDGDLAHVRSLKLFLMAHRSCCDSGTLNDTNILLLKHCSSVICLDVTLEGRKICKRDVDMIKSGVPYLAHVTSLTINLSDVFDRHDFGVGVASLLTRFKNLRHLRLHLPLFQSLLYDMSRGLGLECDHRDRWTSRDISMAHLQIVELTGLTGTDCELWFMKAVLTSARGLRKVAISFNPKCGQHQGNMDAFESMLLHEGMWTSRREAFKLVCMNL